MPPLAFFYQGNSILKILPKMQEKTRLHNAGEGPALSFLFAEQAWVYLYQDEGSTGEYPDHFLTCLHLLCICLCIFEYDHNYLHLQNCT